MKVIKNSIIPFGSFVAMTIGPWIFTKRASLSDVVVRHESIHWEQQKELAIVGFYVLYVLMFIWELLRCILNHSRGIRTDGRHRSTWKLAYRGIIFEREAYTHENEPEYLSIRSSWAWMKHKTII